MSKNPGKRFEQDFEKSLPDGVYRYRLRDCGGWSQASTLRFTPTNGFDYLVYDGRLVKYGDKSLPPITLALEMKSTKNTSLAYAAVTQTQLDELSKAADSGLEAGVVIEFREGEGAANLHLCVYIDIVDWVGYSLTSEKKSINRSEALEQGYLVPSTLVRTRYRYDLDHWLRELRRSRL
jgi:recombination protein U